MAMAADCTYSGTTATCCILSKERIVTGWVGDSRAVIGRRNGKATLALTEDHRPELLEEAQRIALEKEEAARVAAEFPPGCVTGARRSRAPASSARQRPSGRRLARRSRIRA